MRMHFLWNGLTTRSGADFDEWWLRGTVNARGAESKGVEFQADWQATDRLLLSANGFVANPEYTEDWTNDFVGGEQQPPSPGNLDIQAGMPMPNSPERKLHVSAYYDVPDVFNGNLWFYIDYSYQSEVWSRNIDIVENNVDALAPSWNSSTAAIGLQLQNGFDVELHVKNLFDEKGYTYVSTGEGW